MPLDNIVPRGETYEQAQARARKRYEEIVHSILPHGILRLWIVTEGMEQGVRIRVEMQLTNRISLDHDSYVPIDMIERAETGVDPVAGYVREAAMKIAKELEDRHG
jgi:hypothetical protein